MKDGKGIEAAVPRRTIVTFFLLLLFRLLLFSFFASHSWKIEMYLAVHDSHNYGQKSHLKKAGSTR